MIIIGSVGHVYVIRVKHYRVLCNVIRSMGAETSLSCLLLYPQNMWVHPILGIHKCYSSVSHT